MHIVKDQTTGEPKAHVLTALEAEALEVRIVEVLQSGVRMNNNESSLFAGILTRLEEARGEGKGPYISIKQWNWLTDVLDKYEPAYTPAQLSAVAAVYAAPTPVPTTERTYTEAEVTEVFEAAFAAAMAALRSHVRKLAA